MPSNTRQLLLNSERIMCTFWHSMMSGLIVSKLQTLLVLVRLPICRWRLISGDERQRRQRSIKHQRGRGTLRNRGVLTPLGH